MNAIDINLFEIALKELDDGWLLEKFSLAMLSAILGYEFIPVAGVKDKGIDGFQYTHSNKENNKFIFQISTEKTFEDKIEKSIEKLNANKISFTSFFYVTNRVINNKDSLADKYYEKYGKRIMIYDQKWFINNANYSQATINAFNTIILSHVHEFKKQGKEIIVDNLEADSRIFVFLRQQLSENNYNDKISEQLIDTLIIFALEGTNPDEGKFKSIQVIKDTINTFLKTDTNILIEEIEKRLKVLIKPPKRVRYHAKENGYCLPYETRLEIESRNLKDTHCYNEFFNETEKLLNENLNNEDVQVKDITSLLEGILHQIFYKQGMEFSNFVLNGETSLMFEENLPDLIGSVVDNSSVVLKNKSKVKTALLETIRSVVYNGSPYQKKYLRSLANTYLMMFLMKWDPKIASYFQSMASEMNIYVCTSILVPALSEYYLEPQNRRYWNLLKGAKNAGVSLFINDTILSELVAHIKKVKTKYNSYFLSTEDIYLSNEIETLYIDEILIRAYFYAKIQKKVFSFEDFIENFVSYDLKTIKDDLVSYLKEEFGIKFITKDSLKIEIDKSDKQAIMDKLDERKNSHEQSENDAELILTIYKLREKYNEMTNKSIFGYKTWWLSTDTNTYKVFNDVLKEKYPVSCYMRPDFLYNYIALAPKKNHIDNMYKEIFPSLLGVNISYHLPKDLCSFIHERIVDFRNKSENTARIKSILNNLSEKLKTTPSARNKKYINHYFDDRIKELQKCEE